MKVEDKKVVQFLYVLKDEQQQVLESTDGEPVAYLHGYNNMMAGLENALSGKVVGDKFSAELAPEDAYGERVEGSVQRVPVKHLQGAKKWKPGMIATVETEQGTRQVTVIKMGKFMATVDSNHPFAGKILTFDLEVVDIRDASAEEITHGHAHGAGGHQH
ncbi:FKBP-type peptidyl-prolyl cis-trans isomerase SlyD [hydrothermal vent metagenome]|uniref:peptidylprolyl isomerase n=1 Tax=hydrothermal vent metagenome TaxID=652676 RepID=A0A3B0ZM59_9ZZZZ